MDIRCNCCKRVTEHWDVYGDSTIYKCNECGWYFDMAYYNATGNFSHDMDEDIALKASMGLTQCKTCGAHWVRLDEHFCSMKAVEEFERKSKLE